MSELDIKSYTFTYAEDNDYYNKLYTEQSGRVYGDALVDFINDFSTEVKELKLDISPTPVSDNFLTPVILPFFCDIDTNSNLKPYKVKANLFQKQWNDSFIPEQKFSISTIDQLFSDEPYKLPNK